MVDSALSVCLRLITHKIIVNKLLTDLRNELIQDWLQRHGPFDAVVDGANLSLINQQTFSFSQVSCLLSNSYETTSLNIFIARYADGTLNASFGL